MGSKASAGQMDWALAVLGDEQCEVQTFAAFERLMRAVESLPEETVSGEGAKMVEAYHVPSRRRVWANDWAGWDERALWPTASGVYAMEERGDEGMTFRRTAAPG